MQQLEVKIISVIDIMWKLELRILTLRKKINFLLLNAIYFLFLVLALHTLLYTLCFFEMVDFMIMMHLIIVRTH